MLTFLKYLLKEEVGSHHVMNFGRFNPPTPNGHGKLIDAVKRIARDNNASHEIVMSHSQDKKKNPLAPEDKLKHAKRMFPDTNFSLASKEKPTVFHHLADAYNAGHRHVTVVVGGQDRYEQFKKMVNDYNGRAGAHGYYKFKTLNVVNAGDRDPDAEGAEGDSATKRREHAHNNDFDSFSKGMPKHMSVAHQKELFKDVRKGLGHND